MKSLARSAFLALCATLVCSCDGPGTAPPTNSSGSELLLENPTSGISQGGAPTDPGTDPDAGAYTLLDTTNLLGPVAFPVGGSVRRLSAFLETDRTLHIWATSDGTQSGTYDRQTNWWVDIRADVPLTLDWVRNGEAPYKSTLWRNDSGRNWQADMPTLAVAHEFRVKGPKGTVVHFKVSARSSLRPTNYEVGWVPDAVSNADLVPMLTMGMKQKPIGTSTFSVRLP
ncbi:MAG: hypothetical protein IPK50_21635 [Fibrobacterota bacterium]|nr:hypothetical protein [Fibrobacterota bacterium]QQS04852.1 MAG: hypothetical protein IPK50_21635 [Fibrobacterota bacterium]